MSKEFLNDFRFCQNISDCHERKFSTMIQYLAKNKISCGIFFAPVVPDNARQFVNYFKDMGINLNFICVLTQEQKKLFLPYADENVVELKEFQTLTAAPKFIFVLERYFGTAFMNYFQACGTKMFFLPYVDDTEALYDLYMKHLRTDYEFRFRHHPCDRKKEVVDGSSWKLLKYFDVSYRTPSEYDMILYCK